MIEPIKVPVNVLVGALTVLALFTGWVYWHSVKENRPIYFYGKEFGVGSAELTRTIAQLEEKVQASQSETRDALQLLKFAEQKIDSLNAEIKSLREQQARSAAANAYAWGSVDDIEFASDGSFTASFGKRPGKGKWKSENGELVLHFIDYTDTGIILGANLREPWTKIKLKYEEPMVLAMDKFDYQVLVRDVAGSETVRVEVMARPRAN